MMSKVSVERPSPVGGIAEGVVVGSTVAVGVSVGATVSVGVGVTTGAAAAFTLTAVAELEPQYDSEPSKTALMTNLPVT